ncbi:DUF5134 domain-containing protein [Microbacterium sp. H83]|uniref:DUF5134 domain-containing protein n=1 Tax=Microbacterium sp. H83 TaxID=1827324 RepID=UPI0007F412C4|nr:DUF5134 domain-containing protein [Microbacterium sp. H83]OAN40770.1 hypothetical protein A4X16_12645 [Microbacterium sp. H83]
MIAAPWNLILTIAFVFTGLVCLIDLMPRLARARGRKGPFDGEILVDVNHILMSAAMIWMSWSMESELALWIQVAVFTALTLALLPLLGRTRNAPARIGLLGHLILNAAMIWMLAAMPLLMAGMNMGHDMDSGMDMGGQMPMDDTTVGPMMMGTPMWADIVNVFFVALSAATMLWWLYRLACSRHHRLHATCHIVMAAGMGVMLILMNG